MARRSWYQDTRRFGMLRVVETGRLERDASLKLLGPDPLAVPRDGEALRQGGPRRARGDQGVVARPAPHRRAREHLCERGVVPRETSNPRRRAGALRSEEWSRIAPEIVSVLEESIARMGTTFSTYRTLWNEPGEYGEQLLVYDRRASRA